MVLGLQRMCLDSEYVVSGFGEDVDGELYLLDHNLGSIYQLQAIIDQPTCRWLYQCQIGSLIEGLQSER